MRKFLHILFFCIWISPMTISAQSLRGTFSTYTSLDGLVHNNILDIYTDSRGFVWICTWNGISRFDGYHFKNYCNDPDNLPVQHNRFTQVMEDANGHLWFQTYDGHLYRFNRFTEQFESIDQLVDQLAGKSYRIGKVLFCHKTGTVWVEFQDNGVVCFSGSKNSSPLTAHSFIGNRQIDSAVSFMCETVDGAVWLVCDRGRRVITITPDFQIEMRIKSDEPIIAAAVVGEGIAFATKYHLISRFLKGYSLLCYDDIKIDGITTLASAADGSELYIGTSFSGVKVLKKKMNALEDKMPSGIVPQHICHMTVDSHNTVWITDLCPGITRFDPSRCDYKHFSQELNTVDYFSDTLSVVQECNDVVWIKMKQAGFGYYNREKDLVEPFFNVPSTDFRMTNGVTAFEIDDDNVMWLSPYYEKGLVKIVIEDARSDIFQLSSGQDTNYPDNIRALQLDRDSNLWVGTKNGRLYCYDSQYNLKHLYSHSDNGNPLGKIYAIFEDSLRNIWVGTKGNGLWRLTPDGKEYKFNHYLHVEGDIGSLSDNHVYAIDQDCFGRIWIATFEGGVNLLSDIDSDRFINIYNNFPNYPRGEGKRVRYILSDTLDRMFIATTEGLMICNPSESPEEMQFTVCRRYPGSKNSIGGNDVIHILKDSSGQIWLSTYGGGLSLIKGYSDNEVPIFVNYTTVNGLLDNIVLAAAEDIDKNIWISTEKGIMRFEPQQKIFTDYSLWSNSTPISYNEASVATDAKGTILFGGLNKLQMINTHKVQFSQYEYRLSFTDLEIQDQKIANPFLETDITKNEIELPYNYLLFRVEFASLNFRLQDKVNYMYYLEGYDNTWTISRKVNSAYYSKVPHGHYTFHVKAFVGNELMNSPEITMKIHIATPPWLSWYAYCIYSILFLAVLWLVMRTLYIMTKLRAETRMEQHMSEMKIRFFTNISHELRTPLTLIIGGLEDLQKRETLSKRGQDSLGMSYKNSKRMLSLINQLLDFRKIVKDKLELKVQNADIIPIAQNVLKDFRDMADERKITLLLTVSHSCIMLWIDTERMESVLYNLLSNAFKFTPDNGRVSLSITCKEAEDEKDCVYISVDDSGVGISKEHQKQIFARFSQFRKAIRRDIHGSGIGLALCREIVELHHGTINVESTVGKGSTFTIKLLRGNQHFSMEQIDFDTVADENNYSVSTDMKNISATYSEQALPKDAPTILLVDDNAEIRKFIFNNLMESYRVIEAVDGVDALDKIAVHQPDVIVTDLIMPRMDGIELVDKLRHNFETSHVPIIMLTAKQTSEDKFKAIKYGADSYITKPFSVEFLLVCIDNLLTRRRLLFEHFSSQSANHRIEEFVSQEDVVVTNRDQESMKELMEWIDTNIHDTELTVNDLAVHLKLGRTTMYNKIKSLTGKSPIELIKEYRVIKAELLIRTGQFSISEVAYQLGFSDPGYFSRCFKEQYKVSPKEYIQLHKFKNKEDEINSI